MLERLKFKAKRFPGTRPSGTLVKRAATRAVVPPNNDGKVPPRVPFE